MQSHPPELRTFKLMREIARSSIARTGLDPDYLRYQGTGLLPTIIASMARDAEEIDKIVNFDNMHATR